MRRSLRLNRVNQDKLNQAKEYLGKGISVIPLKHDTKFPAIYWSIYTERHPTNKELEEWFGNGSDFEMGIVTGKISNLCVLDFEHGERIDAEEFTAITRTASGGFHLYYRYNPEIKNAVRINGKRIDIRSDRGFVVAPPSRVGGKEYTWVRNLNASTQQLPPFPDSFKPKKKTEFDPVKIEVTPEGSRNDSTTRFAGKILHHLPKREWDETGWIILCSYNNTYNDPPLPESELRIIFQSIASREASQESDEEELFKPESVKDLFKRNFSNEGYLIDKIIPAESTTIIAGDPASFKTWIVFELARCVADGDSFLSRYKAKEGGVLIIDKENGAKRIRKRLMQLGVLEYHPIYIETNPGFFVTKETMKDVLEFCLDKKIKLVTMDSFRRLLIGDENKSDSTNNFLNAVNILKNNGITVIIVHHYRKEMQEGSSKRSMRGSGDIEAGVDCMLQAKRTGNATVILEQTRNRDEVESLKLNLIVESDREGFEFKEQIQVSRDEGRGKF